MSDHGEQRGANKPKGDALVGDGAGTLVSETGAVTGEAPLRELEIPAEEPTLSRLATLDGKNPVVVGGITVTDEEREAARRDGHNFSDEDLAFAMFHGFY